MLYSYKKKADVFVSSTSLKSGYSPKKYNNLVGTPIILRKVLLKPTLELSGKYLQADKPIFDDYALKPKEAIKSTQKDPIINEK